MSRRKQHRYIVIKNVSDNLNLFVRCLSDIYYEKILAFKTSDNVKLKNDLGIRDGVKNFIDFCGVVDWGIDRM